MKTVDRTIFRLTLNAPSAQVVIGEKMKGMEIEMGRNAVRIRPVEHGRSTGKSVQLEPGDRGGLEAVIEGENPAALLRLLQKLGGGQRKPYFSLHRDTGGWYRLQHEELAPPRHIPAMRVWPSDRVEAAPVPVREGEPAWAVEIRKAQATLEAYQGQPKVGRPSKEVLEARVTMEAFRTLAAELLDGPDPEAIKEAIAILQRQVRE